VLKIFIQKKPIGKIYDKSVMKKAKFTSPFNNIDQMLLPKPPPKQLYNKNVFA
jgi:hypothetical protein